MDNGYERSSSTNVIKNYVHNTITYIIIAQHKKSTNSTEKTTMSTISRRDDRAPFRDKRIIPFPRHRDRNRNRDRIRVLNHWLQSSKC